MANTDRLGSHRHNVNNAKADICLEQPELLSIMGDQAPQEVQARILQAIRQTHVNNLEKLRAWNSKVRTLYSASLGLINNGVESYKGYGWIQTALDVRQQSIVRRAGPFIKPPSSSPSTSKPSPSFAGAPANVECKRRTRGKGRVIRGHSP